MATLADFLFFDSTSTTTTSNNFSLPYGTETVSVQVDGVSANVSIEGTTELDGNGEWYPLTAVNNDGYSAVQNIVSAGIYSVSGEGIRMMRAKNAGVAGSVKVHAVAVGH